jgi:Rnl2 family RNA ligase
MLKYPSLLSESKLGDTTIVPGMTFLVTEKLHGTNMQMRISTDGEITAYRRNDQLREGEKFYEWERIVTEHRDKLRDMANGKEIALFGEIIGGYYPGHPSRKVDQKPVQKQIYYCPEYEFVAFDVYDFTTQTFWGFDELLDGCKSHGIRVVEPWYRHMNLVDIIAIDHNAEQSRMPYVFGLPPIENNVIEGWVIRPEQSSYWSDHTLFKWRTTCYLERTEKKKLSSVTRLQLAAAVHASLSDNPVLDRVVSMIVPHRLTSVKSKLLQDTKEGDVGNDTTPKPTSQVAMYLALIREDIVNEIRRDDDNPTFDIPPEINKQVSKRIVDMIKKELDHT